MSEKSKKENLHGITVGRKQKESIKRPPCEFIARRILPVVRARLATKLLEAQELYQVEVNQHYTKAKEGKTLKTRNSLWLSMNLENFREEETEQSDVKTVSPSFWKKEASRLKKLASEL